MNSKATNTNTITMYSPITYNDVLQSQKNMYAQAFDYTW